MMGEDPACVWCHFVQPWKQNAFLEHQRLGRGCRGIGRKGSKYVGRKQSCFTVFVRSLFITNAGSDFSSPPTWNQAGKNRCTNNGSLGTKMITSSSHSLKFQAPASMHYGFWVASGISSSCWCTNTYVGIFNLEKRMTYSFIFNLCKNHSLCSSSSQRFMVPNTSVVNVRPPSSHLCLYLGIESNNTWLYCFAKEFAVGYDEPHYWVQAK